MSLLSVRRLNRIFFEGVAEREYEKHSFSGRDTVQFGKKVPLCRRKPQS